MNNQPEMPPLKYNNAAGRLYRIFKYLEAVPDNPHITKVWWDALGLHRSMAYGDTPVHRSFLFHHLSMLSWFLDDIEKEVTNTFLDDKEMYLSHFNDLRALLTPINFSESWHHVKANLSKAALSDLGHCAKDLPKESDVALDETTTIYNEIEELRRLISQSQIDPRLKQWLRELSNEMQRALDEYEYGGGKSFEKAWSLLYGNMMLRLKDLAATVKASPEVAKQATSLIDKIGELARRTKVTYATIFMIGAFTASTIERLGEHAADGIVEAVAKRLEYQDNNNAKSSEE
jgi:hypothetical protein